MHILPLMKLKEIDKGGVVNLELRESWRRTFNFVMIWMIFLGTPIIGMAFAILGPSNPMILVVIIFIAAFFTFITRAFAESGIAIIDNTAGTITIRRHGIFGSKFTIPINPDDKIILKRSFRILDSTSSNNTSTRRRLAYLRSLRAEKEAILYHTLSYDGYQALVPRDDLTPDDIERIRQIDEELVYREGGLGVSYSEEWEIAYLPANTIEPIRMLSIKKEFDNNMNEFVERVAEIAQIKMIDHSGIYPEIIPVGQTDADLASKVRAANVQPLKVEDMNLRENLFKSRETENGIELEGVSDKLKGSDFLRGIIGAILLLIITRVVIEMLRWLFLSTPKNSGEWTKYLIILLLWLVIGFPIAYFGFRLLDGIIQKDIIIIDNANNKVTYKRNKLISRKGITMDLEKVERILVVRKGDTYTVELVSDEMRMPFGFGYSLDDAKKFRDVIVSNLQ